MHSAVLQNKDYIKFSEKNTVEVICEGSLKESYDAKEKGSETYKGKRDGQEIDLMVEWPSLTIDEMVALDTSEAGQYNKTGKIPYTCIVDPYTKKEVTQLPGASSASKIQEAVLAAKKELEKAHGKGVTRKQLDDVKQAEIDSADLAGKGEYAKALAALAKVGVAQDAPQLLTERMDKARRVVIDGADKALTDIETLAKDDAAEAKRQLNKLVLKLGGTGLEARAKELLASI